MDLYRVLEKGAKKALKEGDSIRLSVLRMLISDIKKSQIDKNVGTLKETELLQIIQKHIKSHRESIAQFQKGNRQDLVDKEAKELEILEKYMPKQLSEAEIMVIVKDTIAATGATGKSDLGKVIRLVMEKVQGRAEGKLVGQLISDIFK